MLFCIILLSSCRKDFETVPSSGNLEFSKDTVYLDTVFSNIGSSTYNLKVYNKSNEDILIPIIKLSQGEASKYRLNVDGIPGKTFENIEILAKDSIFIFIETTVDIADFAASQNQFLYTDAIEFDTDVRLQKVELVTLIKDAVFLYPELYPDGTTETLPIGIGENGETASIEGFYLEDEELTFTNEKPYVIYGYAGIPSNKTLEIQAGARIHFHANSGIIAANNASLHVNGALSSDPILLENEVIFEADRLEPAFRDVPGQWGTIWLTEGSTNHIFNYATIKNASVGILMDSSDGGTAPTLTLKNTQIYNSSNVGLLARTGNIVGENLVINNSGQSSLHLSLGGTYHFKHSTFANYWQYSYRQFPAVYIENALETPEEIFVADLSAQFSNCIIYGNNNLELVFNINENAAFDYNFQNCLIKFIDLNGTSETLPEYDFSNEALFQNIILNESPDFYDPQNNLLMIGENAAANGTADMATANEVPFDILGTPRNTNPDMGAYESILLPED
ncbi:MAG TPA: hypothetical protein VFM70_05615 [Salinimicrobium sp.]|nr:hypothetical protein [Salinimicrobium sp.]